MLLRMIDRNKSTRYWTNLVESLWNTSSLLGSLTTAFGMFSLLPLCSFPWLHHRKSALGFWIPCPMSQDYFDHKTKKKPICYLYTKNFLQSTGKTWLQNIGIISTVLDFWLLYLIELHVRESLTVSLSSGGQHRGEAVCAGPDSFLDWSGLCPSARRGLFGVFHWQHTIFHGVRHPNSLWATGN